MLSDKNKVIKINHSHVLLFQLCSSLWGFITHIYMQIQYMFKRYI